MALAGLEIPSNTTACVWRERKRSERCFVSIRRAKPRDRGQSRAVGRRREARNGLCSMLPGRQRRAIFSRQKLRMQEHLFAKERSFRTAVALFGSGFTSPEEEMHFLGQYNGCEEEQLPQPSTYPSKKCFLD